MTSILFPAQGGRHSHPARDRQPEKPYGASFHFSPSSFVFNRSRVSHQARAGAQSPHQVVSAFQVINSLSRPTQ